MLLYDENNCVGYKNEHHCSILVCGSCKNCAFFKTKEEVLADRQKTTKRLQKLGIYEEIVNKYGGIL